MKISGSYQRKEEKKKQKQIISAKEQNDYYLCNKTTSIGVNRVVEFKCIFFVIYTASSDYQEHFVDSSYQVSIPHFILKELTLWKAEPRRYLRRCKATSQ